LTTQPPAGQVRPQATTCVQGGLVVRPSGHLPVRSERPEADQLLTLEQRVEATVRRARWSGSRRSCRRRHTGADSATWRSHGVGGVIEATCMVPMMGPDQGHPTRVSPTTARPPSRALMPPAVQELTSGDRLAPAATMPDVHAVEVIVAHHERATLRVGEVFLKIDADQTNTDIEVEAMTMVPVPTPEICGACRRCWRLPLFPGTALGRLGEPSTASAPAWAAAGTAVRMLHEAPLPPWQSRRGIGQGFESRQRVRVAPGQRRSPLPTGHAQPGGCRGCTPTMDTGPSRTATYRLPTCSSMVTRSRRARLVQGGSGRCHVRPRHPDARSPGAPQRRCRGLRCRRRRRRGPPWWSPAEP
jgi:hypothetical protein